MAAPTVLIRNIHHGVCKDEEGGLEEREGRRAGRAVVRKVGAYELSEGREGNVEDRMIRGEKGRRRRSRVPFIQRSRGKRQRRGGRRRWGCGGWLEMNRFTHRE